MEQRLHGVDTKVDSVLERLDVLISDTQRSSLVPAATPTFSMATPPGSSRNSTGSSDGSGKDLESKVDVGFAPGFISSVAEFVATLSPQVDAREVPVSGASRAPVMSDGA